MVKSVREAYLTQIDTANEEAKQAKEFVSTVDALFTPEYLLAFFNAFLNIKEHIIIYLFIIISCLYSSFILPRYYEWCKPPAIAQLNVQVVEARELIKADTFGIYLFIHFILFYFILNFVFINYLFSLQVRAIHL
jgi:hypothetical protein